MNTEAGRIVKIVNAVRKHECLWDVNSNDYNKRDKLEQAWTKVSQEVGKSDVFCRDKWRNVRTGFLRSVQHQIRKSDDEDVPSDFHTVKRKRFYLYDQMAFLLPSAECLEVARKKRRKSRDPKQQISENEDESAYNDYCDNTSSAYSIVAKYEQPEECGDHDAADDNTEGGNQECDQNKDDNNEDANEYVGGNDDDDREQCSGTTRNNQKLRCAAVQLQNDKPANIYEEYSPTTRKIMTIIDNQCSDDNNVSQVPNNNNNNSLFDSPMADTAANNIYHKRDEDLLIHFFRSCIDDILSLDKKKQRFFKRRMLDLVDELLDSK